MSKFSEVIATHRYGNKETSQTCEIGQSHVKEQNKEQEQEHVVSEGEEAR